MPPTGPHPPKPLIFQLSQITREVELPAGAVIVPMNQCGANVVINLQEPQAPDSLLRWGFPNAIFEPKEYGEPRVLEKLVREMMARDPALKAATGFLLSQE